MSIPRDTELGLWTLPDGSNLCKHSPRVRWVTGAVCGQAGCRVGWVPGVSGHGCAQDVHDVAAVLAGGVGVAADVEPVLGGVLAGEPSGDLLLGLEGSVSACTRENVIYLRALLKSIRVLLPWGSLERPAGQ